MQRALNLLFLFIVSLLDLVGQPEEFRIEDYSYSDQIKTVKFHLRGNPVSLPIVEHRGSLELSFDDLTGGNSEFAYKIIHCDKDWQISDLIDFEYIEGFNDELIRDYQQSSSSFSEYTNYNLVLPNEDLAWTISGNYLLLVYDSFTNDPILSRRFVVYEKQVDLFYRFTKPRDVMTINTHQAIEFKINNKRFPITKPTDEIYLSILQNGVWSSALMNFRPKFLSGDFIEFGNFQQAIFPALKEFRFFDTRSLEHAGINTHSVELNSEGAFVLLDMNKIRKDRNYLYTFDANGLFYNDVYDDFRASQFDANTGAQLEDIIYVQNRGLDESIYSVSDFRSDQNPFINSEGPVIENPSVSFLADYSQVIFTLENDYRIGNNDLYVIGAFSDWQPYEEYKMSFDEEKNVYYNSSLFKQGYYDYMIASVNEDGVIDLAEIEGNWFESENNYSALIYFREFGSRYDRVIGFSSFNSNAY